MIKQDTETGRILPTHGMKNHPIYSVFGSMKDRCYNPSAHNHAGYGGRGIKICEEWLKDRSKFFSWAISNGYERGLQIDRIDNEGSYEPSNCRFTTIPEQARNRRSSLLNAAQVAEIKNLLNSGYSFGSIAETYGCGLQNIGDIKRGRIWKEIEPSDSVPNLPPSKVRVRHRRTKAQLTADGYYRQGI